MSALRFHDRQGKPILQHEGPNIAIPPRGYSLRGHVVVPLTAYARQRQVAAAYVKANREEVNARQRAYAARKAAEA